MTTAGRRAETAARRRELFDEASAILSLEFPHAPSLEDLARRLASSPRQLERAFSEAGEPGPRAYLRRVRMTRAAELLKQGWSVQETAELVGYSQPAQFAKAFRRQHGRLPSEIRRSAPAEPESRAHRLKRSIGDYRELPETG